MKNFEPYQDSAGVFRLKIKDSDKYMRNSAVRNPSGNLARDMGEAEKDLAKYEYAHQFMDDMVTYDCSWELGYDSSVEYYGALEEMRVGNYNKALARLDKAKEICPEISFASAYYYVKATIYQKLDGPAVAKESAEKFLALSGSTEAFSFSQNESDSPQTFRISMRSIKDLGQPQDLALKEYRDRAFAYLEDDNSPLELAGRDMVPQAPKYYPNNFFRPGGNKTRPIFVAPIISSNLNETGFGLVATLPLWKLNVSPYFTNFDQSGSYYGVLLRHPFFETLKRDVNLEWFVDTRTAKLLQYTFKNSEVKDIKVVRDGSFSGIGFGATKRWSPRWGLASQVHYMKSSFGDVSHTYGSLYGFYDFNLFMSVFTGWVNDHPRAGVEIAFLQIGYDFKDDKLSFGINGILF